MTGVNDQCRYSVDNNTLMTITAHYPPHLFPGVWRRLEALSEAGRFHMCEEVANEHAPLKPTPLSQWIEDQPAVIIALGEFQDWFAALMADAPLRGLQLVDEEQVTNREAADPYVVALALMLDGRPPERLDGPGGALQRGVVVTEEKSNPAKRPAKIPDVCLAYHLACINWLGLLEREDYTDLPA